MTVQTHEARMAPGKFSVRIRLVLGRWLSPVIKPLCDGSNIGEDRAIRKSIPDLFQIGQSEGKGSVTRESGLEDLPCGQGGGVGPKQRQFTFSNATITDSARVCNLVTASKDNCRCSVRKRKYSVREESRDWRISRAGKEEGSDRNNGSS